MLATSLDAEALAELAQNRFQTLRIQHTEDVAERVVAGDAVSKLQELPQQGSAFAEELELGEVSRRPASPPRQ